MPTIRDLLIACKKLSIKCIVKWSIKEEYVIELYNTHNDQDELIFCMCSHDSVDPLVVEALKIIHKSNER